MGRSHRGALPGQLNECRWPTAMRGCSAMVRSPTTRSASYYRNVSGSSLSGPA